MNPATEPHSNHAPERANLPRQSTGAAGVTAAFVPLTTAPAATGQREFRATIMRQGEAAGITNALKASAIEAPCAMPIAGKLHEPRITVQRDDGRIVTIHVQCACGQAMDLACVYEKPGRPA